MPGSPEMQQRAPCPAAAAFHNAVSCSCSRFLPTNPLDPRDTRLVGPKRSVVTISARPCSMSAAKGRASARLSSILRMSCSRAAGICELIFDGASAGCERIASRVPYSDAARNGCSPVVSSYRMRPSEKMSLAPVTSLHRACSGDI